jgi:hypothetical protein
MVPNENANFLLVSKHSNLTLIYLYFLSKILTTLYAFYFFFMEAHQREERGRFETKIFVFAFSRKLIFVFAKIFKRKYTKITKIFSRKCENCKFFAKNYTSWEITEQQRIEVNIINHCGSRSGLQNSSDFYSINNKPKWTRTRAFIKNIFNKI